jgi:lipoyl(octanoyl) transferase
MRQWRLIVDKPMNGAANMAADEAILRMVATGDSPPTLRLYAWEPFCLSLGYGQRARDVDLERMGGYGWEIVRRPTGGRAILHGDELTYSVSLPGSHALASGGIIDTYLRLSRALLGAMAALGLQVMADPDGDTGSVKGPVCFEVPSKYEITIGGKKLIGSAQMRRHGGVLQHGTIPLEGDIGRIVDALAYPDANARESARQQVRARAATLAGVGLAGVMWDDVAAALASSFTDTLQIELEPGEMSEAEFALADELYRKTYDTSAWTFKR